MTQTARAIAKNLGWMLASRGVLAVLSLAYLAIATRTLGIEKFGKFALALGIGQAIATLVAFQSWHIVVRYGMEHLVERRRDALARLLNFTLRLDLTSAAVGAVLVCLIMPLLGLIETPRRLPNSITEAVLEKNKGKAPAHPAGANAAPQTKG